MSSEGLVAICIGGAISKRLADEQEDKQWRTDQGGDPATPLTGYARPTFIAAIAHPATLNRGRQGASQRRA